jgi:hypothetical protein
MTETDQEEVVSFRCYWCDALATENFGLCVDSLPDDPEFCSPGCLSLQREEEIRLDRAEECRDE